MLEFVRGGQYFDPHHAEIILIPLDHPCMAWLCDDLLSHDETIPSFVERLARVIVKQEPVLEGLSIWCCKFSPGRQAYKVGYSHPILRRRTPDSVIHYSILGSVAARPQVALLPPGVSRETAERVLDAEIHRSE